MRWSATDESQRHARDVRSSSPGLLAFIPFAATQNAVSTILPSRRTFVAYISVDSQLVEHSNNTLTLSNIQDLAYYKS